MSSVEIFNLVAEAIRERKQLWCTYATLPRGLCPHVLGFDEKGRAKVLCYQFAGDSGAGLDLPPAGTNWRCLHVDCLSNVRLADGPWHGAPNYSAVQRCIFHIMLCVVPAEILP